MPIILYEPVGGIANLTLNRPEVLNALNLEMRDELWYALDAIEADEEMRVIVLRGAGERAFSAGADLTEFGTSPSYDDARRARLGRDLWGRLLHYPKPLIAAIHGWALGAGFEMSLLCDLRLASDDARFGLPETSLGYLPTAGGSQTLPRFVGPGRALDMVLTAEPVDATQAFNCGLVHWTGPRADLDATAVAWARQLADLDPTVLHLTRRSLREGIELSLTEGLQLEARLRSLLSLSR
jgi:enoyl-CoA hydratase/carnithine racemase